MGRGHQRKDFLSCVQWSGTPNFWERLLRKRGNGRLETLVVVVDPAGTWNHKVLLRLWHKDSETIWNCKDTWEKNEKTLSMYVPMLVWLNF
jgi:hypothetical protein